MQINNSKTIQEIRDAAKLVGYALPNTLNAVVSPVLECNPAMMRKINVVKYAACTNATTQTVFTTDASNDFYICAITLGVSKDATSTSTNSQVKAYLADTEAFTPVAIVAGQTLVAQNETVTITFAQPMKLKRNSVVQLANTTNVANCTSHCIVYGFIDEVSRQ